VTSIFIYAFLVFLASLAGGLAVVIRHWHPKMLSIFISFGAGVILTTALIFLIPPAIHDTSALWILAGFLFIFLGENFIMMHGCMADDCQVHNVGLAAFIGLSFHALAAGLAIGAGVLHSENLGFMTFLAIILHKAPESLTLSSVMLHDHYSRKRTTLLILLFSLIVPFGALLSYFILKDVTLSVVPAALAFSAGTFLEVGASDLLPQVHRPGPLRIPRLLGFLAGIALTVAISAIHHHH